MLPASKQWQATHTLIQLISEQQSAVLGRDRADNFVTRMHRRAQERGMAAQALDNESLES